MKVDGKEVSALLMSQDQLDSDVKPNGGIAINSDTGGLWSFANGRSYNATGAGLGWELYQDSDTVESPQSLTATTDNVITIDTRAITSQTPNGGDLWSTSSNKITLLKSGDLYLFRLSFDAKIANANGRFDIKVDIGVRS